MSHVPLEIHAEGPTSRDVKIILDHRDITRSVSALKLEMRAGDISQATITVFVGPLAIDGEVEALFDRVEVKRGENERTSFASRFRERVRL